MARLTLTPATNCPTKSIAKQGTTAFSGLLDKVHHTGRLLSAGVEYRSKVDESSPFEAVAVWFGLLPTKCNVRVPVRGRR